jgi:hypothetical protein
MVPTGELKEGVYMREMTLTQLEVSGIQDYIFGSNNLKQNIGASELVTQVTTDWVIEILNELGIEHNAIWDEAEQAWRLSTWSEDFPAAQVIYWGGGNALILFAGPPPERAIPFAKALTRTAVKKARGLSLIVGHERLDWDSDAVASVHKQVRRRIAERKLNRRQSVPLPGLGVTANCVFTGLPAVGLDEDNSLIAQSVQHKYQATESGKGRVQRLLQTVSGGFSFTDDFNLMGERGESSYIAVIHADGNGMGKRFGAIADAHPSATDNDNYCCQLRRFSEAVQDKATSALRAMVQLLVNSVDPKNGKFGGAVPFPVDHHGKRVLPFRPIVFGGDDVTFVSEGRLGLFLAAYYLRHLGEGAPLPGKADGEAGEPFYARAGVAIVKSHYPFSRAYELADALCSSAKKKLPTLTPQGAGIALDWHYATSGVILSLGKLREREYRSYTGHSLLMRPVRLDVTAPPTGSKYWRSWDNFAGVTRQFQENSDWYKHRNKIKALREPLRQGGEAVRLFRKNYGLPELPKISGQSMTETGWHSEDCGYFDAIEAMDFFVDLQPKSKQENVL